MLRLVFTLGWLPAVICARVAQALLGGHVAGGVPPALSGAGTAGVIAAVGLTASLAILSAAYIGALVRPPRQRELTAACLGSLAVALLMPVIFSADVYAYAYYGDLVLHGRNPYTHDPAPRDALAAAAVAAWNGHIPPRCVYGPLAIGFAALADIVGSPGGVAGIIFAQRLSAILAYGAYVAGIFRIVHDPKARTAFVLNPVVVWSVAEGHNDAAMLAFIVAALAAQRWRPLLLGLAILVKAPAVALCLHLRRRDAATVLGVAVAAYLPLAAALGGFPQDHSAGATPAGTTAWESPVGLIALVAGRLPAGIAALGVLCVAASVVRRLAPHDRATAFALAAWSCLPNAYPWYALWIVPLAARHRSSRWSRALLVASLCAPARAITDVVFGAPDTLHGPATLHPAMIAVQYLPAFVVLLWPIVRKPPLVGGPARPTAIATIVLLCLCIGASAPSLAQSTAPSPMPAAPPATPIQMPSPTAAPVVAPAASGPPGAPLPALSPAPSPLPTSVPSAGAAPSIGAPSTAPPPQAAPQLPPPSPAAPLTRPAAGPGAAPGPFGYIINPTPTPATTPDGPHIIQVAVNDRRIHAGGPLVVHVVTSANVVGVEARALGRFIAIPQSSPGQFALAYTMPGAIPFWLLNRNYEIVIAAATADGRQTSVSFPMLLTR